MLGTRPSEADRETMTEPRRNSEFVRLPWVWIDRLTQSFGHFFAIEVAGAAVLFLCTFVTVLIANSPFADSYLRFWEIKAGLQLGELHLSHSLRDWVNDAFMTFFFFFGSLELKKQFVLGELNSYRMAALSIAGAAGGMLLPAVIYLMLQAGQEGASGWGAVMPTDTAFVIGCLALLGSRIPQSLRVFMLSLAIVDDIGAILIVAIGYSTTINWANIAWAMVGVCCIRLMAIIGIRNLLAYFAVGSLIWLTVDHSGVHATIIGVILGLLTPARRWVSDKRLYAILNQVIAHPTLQEGVGKTKNRESVQMAEMAARETLSPIERLEIMLHPWVGFFIMPLFALANAGIVIAFEHAINPITLSIVVAFVIGKPLGVTLFCWIAVRAGLATLPADLNWGLLMGASLLAGIGFTMSLFISNLAFAPNLIESAKLGILIGSIYSALAGLTWLLMIDRLKPENRC